MPIGRQCSSGFWLNTACAHDAEGNILQVDSGSTGAYVYDALNHKVSAKTQTVPNLEFIFDLAGHVTSLWTSPISSNESHIFADSAQIAFRSGDGHTYFNHKNWLNTDRVHTDLSGATAATYTSLPFGDGGSANVSESNGGWDFNRFGDIDINGEDNTYHAQFRQYSQLQARWLSPDPYDGSYDASNPQSFNRYAYVLNNPLSLLDPTGTQCQVVTSSSTSVTAGGTTWTTPGQIYLACNSNSYGDITTWFCVELGNCNTYTVWGPVSTSSTAPKTKAPPAPPAPSKSEITKQCVQQYQNTLGGKAINLLSLGAYVPGWGPDPKESFKELGLALGLKFGGGKLTAAALNRFNTQTITSLFSETTIASAAGTGLNELIHGAGIASGIGTIYATGLDLLAHAGCATVAMQTTGQMTPVGPGYIP